MSGFIIQDGGSGVPSYFSAKTGKNLGAAGHGWLADKDQALAFARERDAQEFIDVYLPYSAPFVTIVAHQHEGSTAA